MKAINFTQFIHVCLKSFNITFSTHSLIQIQQLTLTKWKYQLTTIFVVQSQISEKLSLKNLRFFTIHWFNFSKILENSESKLSLKFSSSSLFPWNILYWNALSLLKTIPIFQIMCCAQFIHIEIRKYWPKLNIVCITQTNPKYFLTLQSLISHCYFYCSYF